jgi:hypothetical protein
MAPYFNDDSGVTRSQLVVDILLDFAEQGVISDGN